MKRAILIPFVPVIFESARHYWLPWLPPPACSSAWVMASGVLAMSLIWDRK